MKGLNDFFTWTSRHLVVLIWLTSLLPNVIACKGPTKCARINNVNSIFPRCLLGRLRQHQFYNSFKMLFNNAATSSGEDAATQKVVSSPCIWISTSPLLVILGRLLQIEENRVGPNTEPCDTPNLTGITSDLRLFTIVKLSVISQVLLSSSTNHQQFQDPITLEKDFVTDGVESLTEVDINDANRQVPVKRSSPVFCHLSK